MYRGDARSSLPRAPPPPRRACLSSPVWYPRAGAWVVRGRRPRSAMAGPHNQAGLALSWRPGSSSLVAAVALPYCTVLYCTIVLCAACVAMCRNTRCAMDQDQEEEGGGGQEPRRDPSGQTQASAKSPAVRAAALKLYCPRPSQARLALALSETEWQSRRARASCCCGAVWRQSLAGR